MRVDYSIWSSSRLGLTPGVPRGDEIAVIAWLREEGGKFDFAQDADLLAAGLGWPLERTAAVIAALTTAGIIVGGQLTEAWRGREPGSVGQPAIQVLPDGRVSREGAARYLGLTPGTLATWVAQKKGPRSITIGDRAFYYLEDLDRYIREHAPLTAARSAASIAIERVTIGVLPDGLVTRDGAARYLGLAPGTLAVWATQKRGPQSVTIGGRAFYYLDDLDRYIQEQIASR
jgi:hypothetical protein